jgi:2-polyprenyl-3-methyl-5-hydroxy-6-metoxy-1,4-benzoquinol methylase
MSGGEVDRRLSERDAADRRYNDALTSVDQALPRPAVTETARIALDLDVKAIRDRVAILPAAAPHSGGLRGRLTRFVWRLVAPVFSRQQELNAVMATHLERMSDALQRLGSALPDARAAQRAELDAFVSFNSILVQYLQQVTPYIDTKTRVLEASLDEVRMAATSAHRAAVAARRAVEEAAPAQPREPGTLPAPSTRAASAGYVGFEDIFRGSPAEIRARQADYVDRFAGASDVLDVGCGRGEFLDLLRERGIAASGVDANAEMVDECRARGLRAQHADALAYLEGLSDDSLGGLTALQVVEHCQPDYLVQLLNTAFAKLRPGAVIVLETINAACWVAYFESFIRDITHVRPLHPDTLKFLAIAAGFEGVDVHFRSPIAEGGRLQRAPSAGLPPAVAALAQTVNANVDRLNERLFTFLDYAVIGVKQPAARADRRTENGEAPRQQGATTDNTGSI